MLAGTYCVTDCETGGLDPRINPLLSVALLVGDEAFNPIDGFALKIKPPTGTVLEVLTLADQLEGYRRQQVDEAPGRPVKAEYFLDVYTGAKCPDKPTSGHIITGIAAEVNGFVALTPQGWDMSAVQQWMKESFSAAEAQATFMKWLRQFFTTAPIGVAHNAKFDVGYVQMYLPELFNFYAKLDDATRKIKAFSSGWYCTCEALKEWNKKAGAQAGENAKLGTLTKLAGYKPDRAHEALNDCYSCLYGLRWLRTGKIA